MELVIKIIIHALKFIQKNCECLNSKANGYRTFLNLNIKINLKIDMSETNGSIEFKLLMLPILKILKRQY